MKIQGNLTKSVILDPIRIVSYSFLVIPTCASSFTSSVNLFPSDLTSSSSSTVLLPKHRIAQVRLCPLPLGHDPHPNGNPQPDSSSDGPFQLHCFPTLQQFRMVTRSVQPNRFRRDPSANLQLPGFFPQSTNPRDAPSSTSLNQTPALERGVHPVHRQRDPQGTGHSHRGDSASADGRPAEHPS